jgi:chromosome segregation protein
MRVTRLEIFGFKSFMERIVLPLEGGVTGVVGPNGCGKSNIVDAIRWVLGETRARTLRGDVLEDVIFNGTDKLRPLGLAEVTMTLRASSGDFFSDLVANSFNAEGLADSILGTQPVVIEEAHQEDPEQAGPSSPPRLTVIEGRLGKTEEDLREADRLAENASKIEGNSNQQSVHPLPASEAKKQSEPTPFLTRFAWLKSVNEVQVTRRLYRSGESEFFINRVPCRLKDMKELFRAAGIGPKAYTIVAQGEVSRIVTARPEERRLILEEAAGVLGLRDKVAAAQRRLEETSTNLARVDDVIKEVSRQVQSLKRQASRAKNRKELKDQIAALEQKISADRFLELEQRRGELAKEDGQGLDGEHQADANLHKYQAIELEARNGLMSMDVEGDDIRSKIDSIKEEINTRLQSEGDRRSRLSELRAFISSTRTEIEKLAQHRALLETRCQEYRGSISTLENRSQEMLGTGIQTGLTSVDDQLAASAQELDSCRARLRVAEQALGEAREQGARADSARVILEQQLQQESSPSVLEGCGQTVLASKLIEGLVLFKQFLEIADNLLL